VGAKMFVFRELNFSPAGSHVARASSIIEHDQTMAVFFSQQSYPIMTLRDIYKQSMV